MSGDAGTQKLIAAARAAFENAYAPYSRFRVGASIETEDGRVFAGANVENASYGLGRCAEQSAVQGMVSSIGARRVRRVVVFSDASPPVTPCGGCRQVLNEFGPDADVLCVNLQGETRSFTVRELLPAGFGPEDLR